MEIPELVRNFSGLDKNDTPLAGGKGASLGEMTNAGISVPPGFVILSVSFEQFIKDTDLIEEINAILDSVDHKKIHTVEEASQKIKELILREDVPNNTVIEIKKHFKELNAKYVAVRSSATAEDSQDHAWAGQLESYLNTTEKDLLEKVKHCWASLFTPRAIFYRFEKGLHSTKISVAVVVQKMVDSEFSGIAFSVHPVTEDQNQLLIEAGFGLGEAIVSGSITPDSYVVEKKPRKILNINVATQEKALIKGKKGGNQWIDVPEPKASSQVLTTEQILELSELVLKIEKHYGFPCDIEWAYEKGKFYITQSRPITTIKSISKEVPKNVISENSLADSLSKVEWDIQQFSAYPIFLIAAVLSGFDLPWGLSYKHFLHLSENKSMTLYYDVSDYKRIGEIFWKKVKSVQDILPLIEKYRDNYQRSVKSSNYKIEELNNLSVEDLKRLLKKQIKRLTLGGGIAHIVECADYVFEQKIKSRYGKNYPSIHAADLSFLKNAELYAKKLFSSTKDEKNILFRFREKYGWIQNSYLGSHEISIEDVKNLISGKLEESQNYSNLSDDLLIISHLFSWKDERKANILRTIPRVESVLLVLAKKASIPSDDIKFVVLEDIDKITDPDFQEELKKRRKLFVHYYSSAGVKILYSGKEAETFVSNFNPKDQNHKGEIKGTIAYPGVVRGVARICLDHQSMNLFKEGEILVTSMTRPEFIHIMKKASAFVTDEGGITSHAAIVAREMKKPCIIGTKIATKRLKDGDLIEVDANHGVVKVINRSK